MGSELEKLCGRMNDHNSSIRFFELLLPSSIRFGKVYAYQELSPLVVHHILAGSVRLKVIVSQFFDRDDNNQARVSIESLRQTLQQLAGIESLIFVCVTQS